MLLPCKEVLWEWWWRHPSSFPIVVAITLKGGIAYEHNPDQLWAKQSMCCTWIRKQREVAIYFAIQPICEKIHLWFAILIKDSSGYLIVAASFESSANEKSLLPVRGLIVSPWSLSPSSWIGQVYRRLKQSLLVGIWSRNIRMWFQLISTPLVCC